MRVAALYDIHGNDAALAAVLADVEALGVELIVIGGDVAGGPFPREAAEAVRALGDRALTIRGNGERELVEARLRPRRRHARASTRPTSGRCARTGRRRRSTGTSWTGWAACRRSRRSRSTASATSLFCHGSPRSDEEIVTALSPEERLVPMLAGVGQRTVVLGHTHAQFDRTRWTASASSTPAAWACPTRAAPRRSGRCSGPASSCAARAYDVAAFAARVRACGVPDAEGFAAELSAPASAAEANEFFERMATAG